MVPRLLGYGTWVLLCAYGFVIKLPHGYGLETPLFLVWLVFTGIAVGVDWSVHDEKNFYKIIAQDRKQPPPDDG